MIPRNVDLNCFTNFVITFFTQFLQYSFREYTLSEQRELRKTGHSLTPKIHDEELQSSEVSILRLGRKLSRHLRTPNVQSHPILLPQWRFI